VDTPFYYWRLTLFPSDCPNDYSLIGALLSSSWVVQLSGYSSEITSIWATLLHNGVFLGNPPSFWRSLEFLPLLWGRAPYIGMCMALKTWPPYLGVASAAPRVNTHLFLRTSHKLGELHFSAFVKFPTNPCSVYNSFWGSHSLAQKDAFGEQECPYRWI